MGERSRAHVEQHFTLELVTDAYADIYRRLSEKAHPVEDEPLAA
jgi:hypothetical protein